MNRPACDEDAAADLAISTTAVPTTAVAVTTVSAPDAAPAAPLQIPRHVAIIMDGNNRWARQQGLSGAEGHRAGGKQLRNIVKAALRQSIEVLTVFAFSSENWRRPPQEVQALMALFVESLDREVPKLHEQSISLRFIGDLSAFSEPLQTRMLAAQQLTAHNQRLVLVCAVNYGGRWDITQAAVRLIESCLDTSSGADAQAGASQSFAARPCLHADWRSRIDETALHQWICLSDLPPVDLCIRTGSEKRISNFLLWQLAYAELVFSDRLWPDFDESCLLAALQEFGSRQRRFGRTSEQVQALTT
jgi:undecaprenyl diphosphate synthase